MGWVARYTSPDTGVNVQLATSSSFEHRTATSSTLRITETDRT